MVLENDLGLIHFHAKQAFVQSKLDTDIYMRVPSGCGSMLGIVLLSKSLYGLQQAARRWYELVFSTMHDYGFENHPSEPCVLRSESDAVKTMLATHVDDMIAASLRCSTSCLMNFT